ncbi:undecaprenyl-phosphate glucose phosphotransferase [Algibacillus agarilyticus]|uniref:undecaprenyl-phosphate glucose phosphotransferase n=1 Tax=Algibacillus agarilyticus TaxID=2234133 RepID=UPI000DCFC4C8|nr:undecaprenyl-phosphate glucose phosphotransferase [Algibacillus agarilyticus]
MSVNFISGYQSALIRLHQTTDLAAVFISAIITSLFFHNEFSLYPLGGIMTLIFIIVSLGVYLSLGMYRPWRGEKKAKELTSVFIAWSFSFSITSILAFIVGVADYSDKNIFIVWYFVGLFINSFSRLSVRVILNMLRDKGYNVRNIIIVGDDEVTRSVIARITQSKWTGYRIKGYFGDNKIDVQTRHLGDFSDVESYMLENSDSTEQVWIALPLSDALMVQKIVQSLEMFVVDIRYVPGLDDFNLINHSVSMVSSMPVINLSSSPMYGMNRFLKACEDRVLSFLILLMISPIMLILALGVKLTSRGPVFYKQERVGWNGQAFNMLKFRSMPINSEANGVQWGNASKKTTTKFGQFIRATSLDELPQFINVFLGDMSIVGPRPERTVFVEEFKTQIPGYMKKHMVKAGITGWAQINGWRGDTDLNKRVECDLEYIQNWSLIWDIKIIFLTLFKGFIHENAK